MIARTSQSKPITAARVLLGFGVLLALVMLSQWWQTPLSAWQLRPAVSCEQGDEVHRTGSISTDRVNVRSLPTVFSNVLSQVNEGHPVEVVCQFGAWSQVFEPDLAEVTWISSGLINLDEVAPLSWVSRVGLILGWVMAIAMMLIAYLKPKTVHGVVDWILQTGDLPEHAKPLISNPKRHHTRS